MNILQTMRSKTFLLILTGCITGTFGVLHLGPVITNQALTSSQMLMIFFANALIYAVAAAIGFLLTQKGKLSLKLRSGLVGGLVSMGAVLLIDCLLLRL